MVRRCVDFGPLRRGGTNVRLRVRCRVRQRRARTSRDDPAAAAPRRSRTPCTAPSVLVVRPARLASGHLIRSLADHSADGNSDDTPSYRRNGRRSCRRSGVRKGRHAVVQITLSTHVRTRVCVRGGVDRSHARESVRAVGLGGNKSQDEFSAISCCNSACARCALCLRRAIDGACAVANGACSVLECARIASANRQERRALSALDVIA